MSPAATPPEWALAKATASVHRWLPCTCSPDYTLRKLIAPDCPLCQYADDVIDEVAGALAAADRAGFERGAREQRELGGRYLTEALAAYVAPEEG